MAIVTGDRYLEKLVKFVEEQAGPLIEGTLVLKLNPAGLHYVQLRLEALHELESLLNGAPVDYLRAYVSDLGDHRALEQLRRILRLLTSLKVVSVLPSPARDPTPLSLLPFGRLKVLELRGCDLSTSAAKGLLELGHTLEKIVCHNSTDALRHVFASRIAEIKDSPKWKRLSFVSCACNGLVLMDESLQLLPAVETLDLSRNKFAKVDNLRKCAKLKHLDLGFNQLRTIASFTEVSSHIVKLVLRNNALTTLRGIEKLKSLEGLDVSYNVISNFSELGYLTGLPSLQILWLEGNPLCCARWYRAQVFSLFDHPEKLKLDDKEINTEEFWKRQIIIARKHKRPASFGFYSPAPDDTIGEGNASRRRKKASRLALIHCEEESIGIFSDQESISCDDEIQNTEEHVLSDEEAGIVDLMNRVELMKKEHSVSWLQEFQEWMDHALDTFVESNKNGRFAFHHRKENYMKSKPSQEHAGESSRYVSDSLLGLGHESIKNVLKSDSSVDLSASTHSQQHYDQMVSLFKKGRLPLSGYNRMDLGHFNSCLHEGLDNALMQTKFPFLDASATQGRCRMVDNVNMSPLTSIDDISESYSSSACPSSPPHYQEDILHRRQNLVEEFLQRSIDSGSNASSDSNTSCSEMDYSEFEPSMPEGDHMLNEKKLNGDEGNPSSNFLEDKFHNFANEISHASENGSYFCGSSVHETANEISHASENGSYFCGSSVHETFEHLGNNFSSSIDNGGAACSVHQEFDCFLNRQVRKKEKRRVVLLSEEDGLGCKDEASPNLYINACCIGTAVNHDKKQLCCGSDFQEVVDQKFMWTDSDKKYIYIQNMLGAKCTLPRRSDIIMSYFNMNIADSRVHETCTCYILCNCVLQTESSCREREVAVLFSSLKKFYVLLIGVAGDESGTALTVLGCHIVEEVREILVGLGLQVVSLNVESGETYLFVTRSIEKSRQLLWTMQVSDSYRANYSCSLRSLEQVQVDLFEKQICGDSEVSILQYALVLFCLDNADGELWLPRSLFVTGGYVLLCIENLTEFSSSLNASVSPYFRLDSCCFISDIREMIIEGGEEQCVTLVLEGLTREFRPSAKSESRAVNGGKNKKPPNSLRWKLKWFSDESLLKFAALLKAIHAGMLLVRCIP